MAKPEQTFNASPDRVFEALLVALTKTNYAVLQSHRESGTVSFRTGKSMATWKGKTVTLRVSGSSRGRAVVCFERVEMDEAVDWGESKKIARKLFGAVEDQLEHDSHSVHSTLSASALLGGFTVVGGNGLGLAPSSVCTLSVRSEALEITVESPPGASQVLIPYQGMTALELGGGQQTSGGGFIGGGFGLQGAAEGMAVASVLNSLTRTTSINTMLRIGSTKGEVLLHHGRQLPDSIRNVLSPLWTKYEAAQRATSASASDDPVALLKRLGELHDTGVLSDEEFQAKKTEILGRM